MRTYNGFVVRDCMGAIENVQNSDVLTIFSSSPVIKVVPRKSIAACDLKDEHQFYVTNNLKDKIDGMVHKANELKSSPDPMQRAIGQELVKILKDYGLVN